MRVRVLLFAALREAVGSGAVELELEPGATAGKALERLRERHPALRGKTCSLAVNRGYAAAERALADGDELALIPPVSGG